jgi:hypothetical protein
MIYFALWIVRPGAWGRPKKDKAVLIAVHHRHRCRFHRVISDLKPSMAIHSLFGGLVDWKGDKDFV